MGDCVQSTASLGFLQAKIFIVIDVKLILVVMLIGAYMVSVDSLAVPVNIVVPSVNSTVGLLGILVQTF